ncbi:hypothetical protein TPHA_0M01970 [Tetrapisispora phaffii CBS 4417]|uniref:Uncharacterized protein n=1 Tax=Tetrapisispora phaffii (strain ATCC 24235 / CBS 4417 / NBRC 1672 / NRRL Y-8282 / UCD 70-5) TaxID=1071381 RepID=G8C0Q7_TETPH|nr:hypothetical protein TPHA_0M01970 [Tetrapisispora phaffii CBS 4417]CCE65772.1 hypothetical protein TPHA_0M01970 [Tetrapisispora phaffii CBS 4417]
MVANLSVAKVLNGLLSKNTPTVIYAKPLKRSIKVATALLSFSFFGYGISFASWSWESSLSRLRDLKQRDEIAKGSTWEKVKFYASTLSPFILPILPLTISVGALLVRSRVVSKVTYYPPITAGSKPLVEFTRNSLLLSRPVVTKRLVPSINTVGKTKIFTGEGTNGAENKSSYIFYLTDKNPLVEHFWDKIFIFQRSGSFFMDDPRTFDALFGGDSIKSLDSLKRSKQLSNVTNNRTDTYQQEEKEAEDNKRLLSKLSEKQLQRAKIHSNSAKSIVQNINSNHKKIINIFWRTAIEL